MSEDEHREIRIASNLARLHLDALELAAREAVDEPNLARLMRVEDARTLVDGDIARLRRAVLSVFAHASDP